MIWASNAKTAVAIVLMLCGAIESTAASAGTHILYQFSGGADGNGPVGPLVLDAAGDLFGTTGYGGQNGVGTVFELKPGGSNWTETVLHSFGPQDGGEYPFNGLMSDVKGNLYGTTFWTDSNCQQYCGIAFKLGHKHGNWKYNVLHRFGGPNSPGGGGPNGPLILDSKGHLFGTTQLGGTGVCTSFPGACGVVFELASAGGIWSETVLYNFRGIPDGAFPSGGLVQDSKGNLFGPTDEGGSGSCNDGEGTVIGCGTVFELAHRNSSEFVTYSFRRSENNGPGSSLIFGPDGRLYGTAGYDVFRLSPPARGPNWTKETIYEFAEGISGTIPSGPLVFDASGNIYVTTASSGLDGYSTVSKLTPPPVDGDPWTATTLATFGTGFDGDFPRGGILLGADGEIYGAVSGSADAGYVFAIDPI